jgi:two-component system phosphate regulon sensor histidine kinase PhoR
MNQRRLLWYLFPSYLVITILSLVAASIYAYYLLSDNYVKVVKENLESSGHIIEDQVRDLLISTNFSQIDSLCRMYGAKSPTRFTLVLPGGKVIADSDKDPELMDNHDNRPEIIQALNGYAGTSIRYSNTLDTELIYVAQPLFHHDKIIGVLRTSVPLMPIENTLSAFQTRIILAGFIITIIIGLISLIISRRINQPLEQMRQGVEKFARGDLSYRLTTPGSKEISRLTTALNQMAVQLNEKITTIVEQKNEQQAVLESMVEGVLAVDTDGRLINLNRAAADLFQIHASESTGKHIYEIINFRSLVNLIKRTLNETSPIEEELTLKRDGLLYLQVHGAVLKNASNEVIGAVIVLNNVTRLRRLEKVRRDFVANVSHEIRTPLTTIKGFSETLLDGAIDDSKAARGFLKIISKQSDRLNAIIEDLLILARLEQEDESDRVKIALNQVPLKKVVKSAIKVCQLAALQKEVKINFKSNGNLKPTINPDLIEQAIVNLLDNAIKFSPNGSEVKIETIKSNGSIQLSVSDKGTGIPKKHLPRLFERFYRVDKARSREQGGTGLGLAIVKHITQVHNGEVVVESKPGKGTKFSIILPDKNNIDKTAHN